jgi:hypothetical protein
MRRRVSVFFLIFLDRKKSKNYTPVTPSEVPEIKPCFKTAGLDKLFKIYIIKRISEKCGTLKI